MLIKLLTLLMVAGAGYFLVRKSGLLGSNRKPEVSEDRPKEQVSTLQECPRCGSFFDPADGHEC